MTIAVTDACIFIDLFMLELHDRFFELPVTLHTTLDVIGELNHEQQQLLQPHIKQDRLKVYNLAETERIKITQSNFPKSLSEVDKTVLHIAFELKAMVLSSDKVVRNCAKRLNLEYHGILWILEYLVDNAHITRPVGLSKLEELLQINPTMPGSQEVMKKVKELRQVWSLLEY